MKKKNEIIVILHGWGLCGDKYSKLKLILESYGYKVFTPDLPGFGKELLKNSAMNLDDYVDFLYGYIRKEIFASVSYKKNSIILIGHSFGGRVAVKYTFKHPDVISGLILSGTPLVRDKSYIKRIVYVIATSGGKIFDKLPPGTKDKFRKSLYFMIGEWDYYKSGPLKQGFKNIIGEEVISYLQKITVPCLLLWGQDDKLVSSTSINKISKDNPLIEIKIINGEGHKFPYENPMLFAREVSDFLKYI